MNPFENQSVQMTLREARTWLHSPPAEGQLKVNGSTPVARMEKLVEQRERIRINQMVEKHNGLHQRATERVEEADAALDLLGERIDEWVRDMQSGRLSPADVIRNISQCPAMIDELRRDYDSVRADAEAAAEFMEQDPADFEASQIERHPSLAGALPVISEAWLRGEPDAADPLADPREPDSVGIADGVADFMRTGRGNQGGDDR